MRLNGKKILSIESHRFSSWQKVSLSFHACDKKIKWLFFPYEISPTNKIQSSNIDYSNSALKYVDINSLLNTTLTNLTNNIAFFTNLSKF